MKEAKGEKNASFIDSWSCGVKVDIFKNERVCDFIMNYIGVIVNIKVLELAIVCVKKGVTFNGWCEKGRFGIVSKPSSYKCEDRVRKLVFENNIGCERSVNWEEEVIECLSFFKNMRGQRKI